MNWLKYSFWCYCRGLKLFDDDVKLYNTDCQQLQEASKSVFLTLVPVIVFEFVPIYHVNNKSRLDRLFFCRSFSKIMYFDMYG